MTKQIQRKLSESKTARWSVLALVAFTMLCGYFITDMMAPLQDLLQTPVEGGGLGWSANEYGKFTSAYGWFNVFFLMLIFGGMILDKMGVRFTGLMATSIMLVGVYVKRLVGHIDFASEDRLEDLFPQFFCLGIFFCRKSGVSRSLCFLRSFLGILYCSFRLGILFCHVVVKLLDGKHVAVVCDGERRHAVGHGLVNQCLYGCLPVKDGVLGVYVEMNEFAHLWMRVMDEMPYPGVGRSIVKGSYFFCDMPYCNYVDGVKGVSLTFLKKC